MNNKLIIGNLVGFILVAYLLNTNARALEIMVYLKKVRFRMLWVLTIFLLTQYASWMTALRLFFYEFLAARCRVQRWHFHVYYITSVTISVMPFHLCVLSFLFSLVDTDLIASGYLKRGFLSFLLVLWSYTLLLIWKPEWTIFYQLRKRRFWKLTRQVLLRRVQLSQQNGDDPPRQLEIRRMNVGAVNSYVELGEDGLPLPVPTVSAVNILDILIFRSSRNGAMLFLIDGRQIYTEKNASVIAQWKSKDWFLKIKNGIHVNMFHLRRRSRYRWKLTPNEKVRAALLDVSGIEEAKLEAMLTVNEWFRSSLIEHERVREELTRDCWDEAFVYA